MLDTRLEGLTIAGCRFCFHGLSIKRTTCVASAPGVLTAHGVCLLHWRIPGIDGRLVSVWEAVVQRKPPDDSSGFSRREFLRGVGVSSVAASGLLVAGMPEEA